MRRGRIFYFRKRLPKKLSNQVSNLFLCLSLRTDLPLDAVKRAAALLTVLEQMEKTHVDALIKDSLTDALDKRISELVATKEDRKRAWLEEHAEALEEHAKYHRKKLD
ncbi:hypothetical protein SAMN05444358_10819 [Ruegeria halocynthiae]|uniref:DUF6538 domain-containing protein n=2 Tax=Ruegeria halocynthiae TaxID=985054 RepID=A0A1H3D8I6_9RHOB|nr:hypothetical protein SAMN05444358_10819 [Ruegeria halocynthiae]